MDGWIRIKGLNPINGNGLEPPITGEGKGVLFFLIQILPHLVY